MRSNFIFPWSRVLHSQKLGFIRWNVFQIGRIIPLLVLFLCVAINSTAFADQAPRKLDTAFGVVSVKGTPKRVIALSEGALDTALAIGVQPVGVVATRGSNTVSDYLQDKVGQFSVVGTSREFNLEAILRLQPDLILAANGLSKDVYATLSKLAPTIVPAAKSTDDWRITAALYASALGKDAELKSAFSALDERIEGLRARLPAGQTVSLVRWMPQGPMVMSAHVFTGQLLAQLGFTSTDIASSLTERPHSDVLSLENLAKIDADWLFLATLNAEGEKTLAQARKQAAFTRLNAVSSNHVSVVNGQVWTSGTGVLAANSVLDDVEKSLLQK